MFRDLITKLGAAVFGDSELYSAEYSNFMRSTGLLLLITLSVVGGIVITALS